jgi:hypothetical protein
VPPPPIPSRSAPRGALAGNAIPVEDTSTRLKAPRGSPPAPTSASSNICRGVSPPAPEAYREGVGVRCNDSAGQGTLGLSRGGGEGGGVVGSKSTSKARGRRPPCGTGSHGAHRGTVVLLPPPPSWLPHAAPVLLPGSWSGEGFGQGAARVGLELLGRAGCDAQRPLGPLHQRSTPGGERHLSASRKVRQGPGGGARGYSRGDRIAGDRCATGMGHYL